MPIAPIPLLGSAAVLIAASMVASETPRIGGSGGRRTVTMDCGTNAYIVGATARGGKDGMIGFNLVRQIKFNCRTFSGITPGATTTQTIQASSDKAATVDVTNGSGSCSSSFVVDYLEFKTGIFIDRFSTIGCKSAAQDQSVVNMNTGGDGGSRAFLDCPSTEALYKVEARVGDAIDSVKGFCRAFGSVSNMSVVTQINATASPKASSASPVNVPVRSSRTFSFTVSDYTESYATLLVGVSAGTDLLGGATLNPPEFKLDLLNPAGSVVASKTFLKAPAGFVHGIQHTINANGVWRLRVTNLKRDIGTLSITSFSASANP